MFDDVFELRDLAVDSVPDLNVVDGRENLVAVEVSVDLSGLSGQQLHGEVVEEGEDVPFDLEQGDLLTGTERAEQEDGVLDLLAVLVELGIHKTVVFEGL